jgi:hypothetical protein
LSLGGSTLNNVLVADLFRGRSVITLDGGNDEARAVALGLALNGFFAEQLPQLLVSGEHQTVDPFVTLSRMAGATASGGDDFGAVNWTYSAPGSKKFTDYILDHGRNLAVGMSAATVLYSARAGLGTLPLVDGGTTVETVGFSLQKGYIEVIASGTRHFLGFKITFDYSVHVTLSLDGGGNLVATADHSRVQLPAWLWFAAGLLIDSPRALLVVGIANIVANGRAADAILKKIDLGSGITDMLRDAAIPFGTLTTTLDHVETNPNGVFLRGNATITM